MLRYSDGLRDIQAFNFYCNCLENINITKEGRENEVIFIMRKRELKCQILYCFLRNGIADMSNLILTYEKTQVVKNAVVELIKDGLIVKRQRKIKRNYRNYIIPFYSITEQGLTYLKNYYSEEKKILSYIPNPIPKFETMAVKNQFIVYRVLKENSLYMMFNKANIDVKQDNQSKDCSFEELMSNIKDQYKQSNGYKFEQYEKELLSPEQGTYYPTSQIHTESRYTEEDKIQYSFQTQSGILTSRSKSYLVYHTNKRGLYITKRTIKRARQSLFLYIKNKNLTTEMFDQLNSAIVFSKNAKEWVQIYTDPDNQRYHCRISQLFQNMYCLPIRYESIAILNNIVKYEEKVNDYYYNIIKEKYPSIKEYGAKLFQAEYQNKKAYIGITMNLAEVETLIERLDSKADEECYVICEAWQKEFYERIMPKKIKYLII